MSEEKKVFKTTSGIEIKEVYTNPPAPLENPGVFPFTRGIQPDMYRGRLWTMRQYAGFSTAEESNKRYHYLLQQGTMGLSVAFDLPTQIGYDSDHEFAEGEVGKVGVAIDSLADMETLFKGITLENVRVAFDSQLHYSPFAAFFALPRQARDDALEMRLLATIRRPRLHRRGDRRRPGAARAVAGRRRPRRLAGHPGQL